MLILCTKPLIGILTCFRTAILTLDVSKGCDTKATVPAAALSLCECLPIIFLSYYEHQRSVRPSALLNLYLLITVILDCARSRTMWLMQCNINVAAVFTTSLAVKTCLLIAEFVSKRSLLRPVFQQLSPEETSGIISHGLSSWLIPVLWTGKSLVRLSI